MGVKDKNLVVADMC